MTISDTSTAALAEALQVARRDLRPISPLSVTRPDLRVDDAYDIQSHQVDQWLQAGDTLAGYKIGLVSTAMQVQMGVREPDFGRVMTCSLRAPGTPLDLAEHISPLIEPELGFVIRQPLTGPGVDEERVLAATEAVVPLLEVVDSRILDWDLTIVDTVADNASSGTVHLGAAFGTPDMQTLGEVECRLYVDGTECARGRGSDVLGHPARAVAWLVNELGRRGVGVLPGQVLLSGSMTRALPIETGQVVEARFGEIGSVEVRAQFAADGSGRHLPKETR